MAESTATSRDPGHENEYQTRDSDETQDQPRVNKHKSTAIEGLRDGSEMGTTSKSYTVISDREFTDTEGWTSHEIGASVPASSPSPASPGVTFEESQADVINDSSANDEVHDNAPAIGLNIHPSNSSSMELIDIGSHEEGFLEHAPASKPIAAVDTTWLQRSEHETAINYNEGWSDTSPLRPSNSIANSAGYGLHVDSEEEHITTLGDTQTQAPYHTSTTLAQDQSVAGITKGMTDVDLNEPSSEETLNNLPGSDSISMQPEQKYQPLQTVVSSKPSKGSILHSASYSGAGDETVLKVQARLKEKPHMGSGRTQNSQNSVYVSTVASSNLTGTQADGALRRSSNASTNRPRGLSVTKVSPDELHEIHLDSEAQSKSKTLDSVIYEEYEDMTRDVVDHMMAHCHEGDKAIVPTYHYPGTYEAAKHDTYEAAKNMGSAALSFGGALVSSGIGKAAWSVGALSLNVGRRAGKHMATQAILSSGYKNTLPTGVQKWVDANEQKRLSKIEAKKHRYQFVHPQGQHSPRYDLTTPPAPVMVQSTVEDTKKVFQGTGGQDPYSSEANIPQRELEDGWDVVSQKDLMGFEVRGKAPAMNNTEGTPYTSTIYGATMTPRKNGEKKATEVGSHVSSHTDGAYDQPRNLGAVSQRPETKGEPSRHVK